jgi:hypothetical protein
MRLRQELPKSLEGKGYTLQRIERYKSVMPEPRVAGIFRRRGLSADLIPAGTPSAEIERGRARGKPEASVTIQLVPGLIALISGQREVTVYPFDHGYRRMPERRTIVYSWTNADGLVQAVDRIVARYPEVLT